MGPFEVTPEQIARLGPKFSAFVNRLLEAEVRGEGLEGRALTFTAEQNTPDGGVDAATRGAPGGDWIPPGGTAWQFKSADRGPAACANELESATWAHEFLRADGQYLLVLGSQLPDKLVAARQKALASRALQLGLIQPGEEGRIKVYEANSLARWTSLYPALAASRLVGGPGRGVSDFESWAGTELRSPSWVPDQARRDAILAIRDQLMAPDGLEVRVQGESGVGKSRLVLEALDDDSLRALVAYIPDERQASAELVGHLSAEGRSVVLVVDDCDATRHGKLADQLPRRGGIRLITIGPTGPAVNRVPIVGVSALTDEERGEFLKVDYPQLRTEARLFIARYGEGNMRMTILLANAIARADEAQAAELISEGDIRPLVEALLPESADFFGSAVLALFDRIGFDRDRRYQLEVLAAFVGLTPMSLTTAASSLERWGLAERHGRYRAVIPRPLAVLLATEAWKNLGDRIVRELLPSLDQEMALAFFRRVADLGRFPPAQAALRDVLGDDGPFASLEVIEASGTGQLLTQLAIVLPNDVTRHLARLLAAAPEGTLVHQTRSRRDLVWTLEKLVWHRENFEVAANALLRLAIEENETYTNNAGGTWVDLFGTRLPGTAAPPAQRAAYLAEVARSDRAPARLLAVRAAAHGLGTYESITVSGELQGGVLVAPRGEPRTWEEFWDYREAMLAILLAGTSDTDHGVVTASEDAIFSQMLGLLRDTRLSARVIEFLSGFEGPRLRRLREEVQRLTVLYSRTGTGGDDRPEDVEIRARLMALEDALPRPSRLEELSVSLGLARWDFGGEEYRGRITDLVRGLNESERRESLSFLDGAPVGAWELGYAYATVVGLEQETLKTLTGLASSDMRALVGYLWGLHDAGDSQSFDNFLSSQTATALPEDVRLGIAVRGPVSTGMKRMVRREVARLPVRTGAQSLFGWQENVTARGVEALVRDWAARTETQGDYNALVTWLSTWLRGRPAISPALRAPLKRTVDLRREFPDVGTDAWQWCRVAERLLPDGAPEIARLLLGLIEDHGLMLHGGDQQAALLIRCAQEKPHETWHEVTERLAESWRVQADIREWLLPYLPTSMVLDWIDGVAERGRLIAAITPVDEESPGEVVTYLLETFPGDQEIAGSLYGTFVTGSWLGNESARLTRQIDALKRWCAGTTSGRVREWASEAIASLERRLTRVLEEEAERDF